MAKRGFWSPQNILVSLKAMTVGIVSQLILIIPFAISIWARMNSRPAIGLLFGLLGFAMMLFVYGWLANKWFGWK